MAREIVIWCDACLNEDVRTPAVEHSAGLDIALVKPVATQTVALCTDHTDQLLKPLAAILEEFGSPIEVEASPPPTGRRKVSTTGRQDPEMMASQNANGTRKGKPPASGVRGSDCLWCDLSYTSGSGGGFQRHLKVVHGFEGFHEAFGGPCPVCGEGPYTQMLAHVSKSHPEMGFTSAVQPFMWARDNGDPHGIYAATLARKGSLDPDQAWEETRARERISNKEGKGGKGGK